MTVPGPAIVASRRISVYPVSVAQRMSRRALWLLVSPRSLLHAKRKPRRPTEKPNGINLRQTQFSAQRPYRSEPSPSLELDHMPPRTPPTPRATVCTPLCLEYLESRLVPAAILGPDPFDSAKTALMITGTAGDDRIDVRASPRGLQVEINGSAVGVFAPTGFIIVDGLAGNDRIVIDGKVTNSALVLGGTGDDELRGGAGADILVGGGGADRLDGGGGRDVLIGGDGSDRVRGGQDGDLLVGGASTSENDLNALHAVWQLWQQAVSDPDPRPELSQFINTVQDSEPDRINGDGGHNLIVYSSADRINPVGHGQTLVNVADLAAVTGVSSTTPDGSYTSGDTVLVTVTFNQAVTVSGNPTLELETGATDRLAAYLSGSGTTTLTFSYVVSSGEVSPDLDYTSTSALALNGGSIETASGLSANLTLPAPGSVGSLGFNKSIVIDTAAPSVTLSSTAPDPTNGAFTVTATFDEDVFGFTSTDITLGNATISNFTATTANRVWTFLVTPSAQGSVTVDVAAGVAQDAAGNDNTAATQLSRTYDSVPPNVILSTTASNPTRGPFTVTATFSEAVTGFALGDVAVGNGVASAFSGSGTTYTFTVTPTGQGLVTIDVAAGAAQDAAGNASTAATQLTRTYTTLPDLSSLDGNTGARFDSPVRLLSGNVASVGDINGDGFDDFVIGSGYTSFHGNLSGSVYVIFGKGSGWTPSANLEPGLLNGTNGFRLDGVTSYDQAGFGVSSAGDMNGDGFDDLLINLPRITTDPNSLPKAFVIFGKASGWAATQDLSDTYLNGVNGFRLLGTNRNSIGLTVASAGDINGDGYDDIILGDRQQSTNGTSSGAAYVVFGKATGWAASATLNSAFLNGTNGFELDGLAARDVTGFTVSGAGDVNGDGYDDMVIGAYGAANNGAGSGAVYVVFGKASSWAAQATLNTTFLNGTTGFRLDGAGTTSRIAYSVSGAGDVNGDGFADILIGSNASSTYVVFGKASGWSATQTLNGTFLNGTDGFRLDGANPVDRAGLTVASAGDINGDGFDDILIGAYRSSNNGPSSGSAYVVFGKASGWAGTATLTGAFLDGTAGFRIDGTSANDYTGFALSSAGDVNGDGFDDFLISAPAADNGQTTGGSVYLVFGGDFTQSVTQLGTSAADTLTGTSAVDVLLGAQNNDTLVSGGGADVLKGGEGNDTIVVSDALFALIAGGRGVDTLQASALTSLNLTTLAPQNRLSGIDRIDLGSSGSTTLTLSILDAATISDNNTLTIDGGFGDTVNIVGGNLSFSGSYVVLTRGGITVRISLMIGTINFF